MIRRLLASDLFAKAARYGLVGLLNTAVGFSIIIGLQNGLGVQPHLANAGGYLVGICISFILSRLFVFGAARPLRSAAPRYVAAVATAFALNQAVLTVVARQTQNLVLGGVIAQACAVVCYTAALFLLCHFWVFAGPRAHP